MVLNLVPGFPWFLCVVFGDVPGPGAEVLASVSKHQKPGVQIPYGENVHVR